MDPGTLSAIQGFAAISLILVSVAVAVTGLRWVWLRTGRPATLSGGELEDLRARVAELEAEQGRVAELEERVDFTERLLARQTETDKLPEGR